MAQIFTSFLLTSVIGTTLGLILTLLKPLTRKIFSSAWHYYIWLVVLLVMILPIRLNLPETPTTTSHISETVTTTDNQTKTVDTPIIIETQPEVVMQEQPAQFEKASTIQVITDFLGSKVLMLSFVWLIGAVLLFLIKIVSYLVFLIKIHKHSEIISCPEVTEYTKRKIETRVSDTICSPLMIGIIRPTLLLPKTNITPEQLHNVLAHEMTHLKRNDILYKWFVGIVKCVHWFNPAIYFINRQINIECEISCDLAVVKEMDEQQEKGYVETILSLLTHNNSKAIPLTTGMTGNRKTLKRRFIMIKNRKRIGKITQILSTILAVVILATTVFTSGVLATAVFEDNSNIHFTCNGKVINFTNKPFYKNNTVYLPIRELFEKLGVMDNENNKIEWDNGKIYVTVVGDITTHYYIEINNNKLGISHTEPFTNNAQMKMSVSLTIAPVLLRNSTTYIPYDFVDYMLNRGMVSKMEDGLYNITCIVKGEPNLAYITPAFTWPSESETVSNTFGKRVHPITGEEKIHNGIDISAPENSPVISSTYGEVIDTGFDKEFGNYIIIENDNGVKVYYGHLSAVEIAKGDKVKQKAVIGKVGKTGTATGANLHFEIQINGEYYNPMKFWKENPLKDVEVINNEELLSRLDVEGNTNEIEWNESTHGNSSDKNTSVGTFESSYTTLNVSTQSNTSTKIKSTSVSEEPYTGFEQLVLKNANVSKIQQELNQQGIVETKKASVDLSKNYVVKDYSSEQTKVVSDENGNISLYLSVNSDNLFDVNFYDAQTNENVGGYGVLANNENAYTFIGFEKGKLYNVEVQGKTKNDWSIEGNYIIY